jgi:hypothetical protein
MRIFENMKPIIECLLGESKIIGATKCVNITLKLYLYIFENPQKKHNNFNCRNFLKIGSITCKDLMIKLIDDVSNVFLNI